jgi:hypothetical protein
MHFYGCTYCTFLGNQSPPKWGLLTPSNGETLSSRADIVDHIGAVNIEAGYIGADENSAPRHSTELPRRTNPLRAPRIAQSLQEPVHAASDRT